MRTSPVRRTLLKTLAIAAASVGLGATGTAGANPTTDALTEAGAGRLRDLMTSLAAAPRRRDFKSVPMILTSPEEWDADALRMVLACKAEPKQVWNNTEIGGYWLTVMRNSLNTQIWGFKHPDFLVVSATHGSAGMALYDAPTWEKYQMGKLLEGKMSGNATSDRFKTNAFLVDKPGDGKDFEDPSGLFSSAAGDTIPVLQKRGVVFMACHNAVWGHAEALIKHGSNPDKLNQEAVAAELTNHLIPGTILTPGIVGTLPELQKAGFVYASI